MDKEQLLSYFRDMSNRAFINIRKNARDYKEQASMINAVIRDCKGKVISDMLNTANINQWKNIDILDAVLMITYAAYLS